MQNINTIGFIGLGVMGEPMCQNIALKHRGKVIGFDIKKNDYAKLIDCGVKIVESLDEIVSISDLIILSLPSGKEVRDLCLGKSGLVEIIRSGQIVLDSSTTPPSLSREIYRTFTKKGVLFADTPVARTRQAAIDGKLSIMVGADLSVMKRIKPILQYIATDIIHCGEVGAGEVCKILNNMVLFQNIAAFSEALVIGEKAGVSVSSLVEAISKSSGDSFALRNHGVKAVIPNSFPEGAFSVNYAKKDLLYAIDIASENGSRADGAERILDLFEQAISQGWGTHYHPVIKRLLEIEKKL